MEELILEIEAFLKTYARQKLDEDTDEMCYTSPDALELEFFAIRLKEGMTPSEIPFPRSSWESGGYSPYLDQTGRASHDQILAKIRQLKEKSR